MAALCVETGLTLTPTFVPFTPWTTLEGYVDLLETIEELQLIEHVAPIQPRYSTARDVGFVASRSRGHPGARRQLRSRVAHLALEASRPSCGRVAGARIIKMVARDGHGSRAQSFDALAALAHEYANRSRRSTGRRGPGTAVPAVEEPWYCCAEPV